MLKAITMIGMPGSGKSSIGKELAKRLGWKFVDLDILILEKTGLSHDRILAEQGRQALLDLENQFTLELPFEKIVFSPGGSIVYSAEAMEKISEGSVVVYLAVPLTEIMRRLGDDENNDRGIVDVKEKGLTGLYNERTNLFEDFAHHVINAYPMSEAEVLAELIVLLQMHYEIF